MKNRRKTAAEIRAMRESGRMLARVLQVLKGRLEPGLTTGELDQMARHELAALGGQPAFLGFEGYPAVICLSVNEEAQHGIPGPRVLHDGDIINLDFGVKYQGMITDSGITVGVGTVSADAERLMKATEESLMAGIKTVHDGSTVGDITRAVERRLLADKLGIIQELCGHGVGHQLHEEPLIPNSGDMDAYVRLHAGMTIAIEPMATLGSDHVELQADDWTYSTIDGSLTAQFEHTVLVTETGSEILTKL